MRKESGKGPPMRIMFRVRKEKVISAIRREKQGGNFS